jgi:glycosyltransferase involved in cell wall biosynthesis
MAQVRKWVPFALAKQSRLHTLWRAAALNNKKLIISINAAWNFLNFRAGLVRALVAEGYEVVAVAPPSEYAPRLEELGCRFVSIRMDARSKNPVQDALVLLQYLRILREERPAAFLGFTIKPNVYGSLAAHMLGVPVINNIAGLGVSFSSRNWLNRLVKLLYGRALHQSHTVFFQNEDDKELFIAGGLVDERRTGLLPGSGVDLSRFRPALARGQEREKTVFILVARLLWSKGIAEYVEAARLVSKAAPASEFRILGILEDPARGGVPEQTLKDWSREGVIAFCGAADDVRPYLEAADCVVLPTYYPEGTPRSLLEGAAMGKPLISTDTPGCRDVIEDGVTGFLVSPRDAESLASAMTRIVNMAQAELERMGSLSRQRAERMFDEKIVIDRYLSVLSRATLPSRLRPGGQSTVD